jgi:hypothetical protein
MRITKTEIKQMIEEEALSYLREEEGEDESGLIDINAGPE